MSLVYTYILFNLRYLSMQVTAVFIKMFIITTVCEISSRPIDNVYVKSSWSMSNFQNFVYNVQ